MISFIQSKSFKHNSMSLLSNAAANFGLFIKRSITKMFVRKVIFSAKKGKIKSQVRQWQKGKDVFLLDSFYHKSTHRAKSYEIVWYVEENALTRWCGLANYKQVRHSVNQKNEPRADSKRKTLRSI